MSIYFQAPQPTLRIGPAVNTGDGRDCKPTGDRRDNGRSSDRRSPIQLAAAAVAASLTTAPASAWRCGAVVTREGKNLKSVLWPSVAELTGGRFKINLLRAGQIVPAAQAFDAVAAAR